MFCEGLSAVRVRKSCWIRRCKLVLRTTFISTLKMQTKTMLLCKDVADICVRVCCEQLISSFDCSLCTNNVV